MTVRVTDTEVKEIISTTVTTTAFITAANITVTALLGSSTVLSAVQLKEIERWLAAHLIACGFDPVAKSEKTDEAAVTYAIGQLGKGLDFTAYGQMVKMLDVTGTLATAGLKKAEFKAIDLDL